MAEQAATLIKAIAELLGILIWPVVIVVVAIRFRSSLSLLVANLSELSFKVPGVEGSARINQVKAAVNLGAAAVSRSAAAGSGSGLSAHDSDRLARSLPDPLEQRRLRGTRILWVDDRPENNTYERRVFEALGLVVSTSTSTDDALAQQARERSDLIISDMGRPPDARAGYTLLDALRKRGDQTPYVIYASSNSPKDKAEAIRHLALGCTNDPQELVEYVLGALEALPRLRSAGA